MTGTLTHYNNLVYGDLFTTVPEDGQPASGKQYLRLAPYHIVDIQSGHVYEMFWPAPVMLLEQVKPEAQSRRLGAPGRRQRDILRIVAASPGRAIALNIIRDFVRHDLPYFRPDQAFRTNLDQLMLLGLIEPARAEVHASHSIHWVAGFQATGAGLLQNLRWGPRQR